MKIVVIGGTGLIGSKTIVLLRGVSQGAGHMPALGFGTLIPDTAETITATSDALEAGFRHFDCAERYDNEREVGRTWRGRDRARTHSCYHKAVEFQSPARARENFDISPLPEDAIEEINRIQTRQRLNPVMKTGVPAFIPQEREA